MDDNQESFKGMTLPPFRIESGELFKGCKEVVIVHLGEEYRLRITKNEKLILNK